TTQFESTHARRAFPCWDEPEFKAVFQVTLVIPPGLTAISNYRIESTSTRPDGRIEVRFAETMEMSTYLVAWVVGPYEWSREVLVEGVPVRVAAVSGRVHLSEYALEVAEHSLRFLTGYFGIPYPGDKLDHVAVPDFAFGAMENLGCVTYRENLLLSRPEDASQAELQRSATVIAHETAHMWFGDLVTMKWWDGIWLNEAFATFMEVTVTDDFRPEWDVWTAFGTGKALALGTDGLIATRPVEYPVGHPDEAEGMFDVLTYQKGGAVLKMLEQYLGPEVFRKGISHYLSTHSYGNTETADLWDALEAVSGEPVRTIMTSWIKQGGYPMVAAAAGDDPGTVVLRQNRFVYDGRAGHTERWAVPVNIRASINGTIHHERALLDGAEGSCTFSGPVDWVVVNDGAWGYYRVRYSPEMWDALMAAGPDRIMTPIEQLQLVGDTWASVSAGSGSLTQWAQAATVLSRQPDPDLWLLLTSALHSLRRSVAGDEDRSALRLFARRLAEPVWADLGWDPAPGETMRSAMARGRVLRVLADFGEDEELGAEARSRLLAHLGPADSDVLPPDLVGAVAQVTVAVGGADEWQTVLDAYHRCTQLQEKLRYLYALGETGDAELRERVLELAIGPDVRPQEAPSAMVVALAHRDGAERGWDWVESRWDRIVDRVPPSLLIRVLEAVTTYAEPELAARVRRFVEGCRLEISPIRVEQVLERMDVNVALAARLRGTLAQALITG
ncbi:MAG TPA: M1 family aminopeptidase, partial [Acidimicrobiales bacterium]|nr:M1 family aminopeptidase [Acidimicrobiales bacterium]